MDIKASVGRQVINVRLVSGIGNDKSFVQEFTNKETVEVNHSFGRYPSVTVVDSGHTEVEVTVDHTSVNQCVVSWDVGPFSGKVFCS